MNQRSGGAGILGLLGLAALFLLLRGFFPSLAKLFLILCGIAALGVAALVAAVIFFAFRKPKKTEKQQQAAQADAALKQGRTQLMALRQATMRVKDPEIRSSCETICAGIDKILRTLKDHPEDAPDTRRFFCCYIPMLEGIVQKYRTLEESGVPAEEAKTTTANCLSSIEQAVEKQYAALFENDALDLTVDAAVLLQLCKRDGLLEEDFVLQANPPEEEGGITLSL